jgi:hypothetical protein
MALAAFNQSSSKSEYPYVNGRRNPGTPLLIQELTQVKLGKVGDANLEVRETTEYNRLILL